MRKIEKRSATEAPLLFEFGHEVPSPEAARKFLYAFHEEEKIQQAKQRRLPDQIAYIPSESAALEGLRGHKREYVVES